MLTVSSNISAINAQRQMRSAVSAQSESLQRLASGLRVQKAADDAAGMQLSNRLTTQIRGIDVAVRNANDGISMVQVAEGALQETDNIIFRLKDLAIQAANGSNSTNDRQAIQREVDQLITELNRINETTAFAGESIFAHSDSSLTGISEEEAAVLSGMYTWLHEAEARIEDYFGVVADGADLTITLAAAGSTDSDGEGGTLAFVRSSSYDSLGRGDGNELVVDMEDFVPINLPDGGTYPLYNDRVLAHEMVHAIFNRSIDVANLPTWFNEGAAEFIHGGDERVYSDLTTAGSAAALISSAPITSAWGGNSEDYSVAYVAVRYMHEQIKAAGGQGIKDITEYLALNIGGADTLDDALTNASSGAFTDLSDFETQFAADGATYIDNMDLTNSDTGAIGGYDADGGGVLTAESVLPNTSSAADPTRFNEIGLEVAVSSGGGQEVSFQVGTQAYETISAYFSAFNAAALGLSEIDVVNGAQGAITAADRALTYVDASRAELGAVANRLQSTINNLENISEQVSESRSRIRDTDFAAETTALTKQSILTQTSAAILAQAQQFPQTALVLLG